VGVRLALFYTALIVLAFSAAGWFSFYTAQRALDIELAQRLIGIARLVDSTSDTDAILDLRPGDEGGPLHRILMERMQKIKESTGVRDIVIFDSNHRVLLDAAGEVPIGQVYRLLAIDAVEIKQIWEGRSSSSTLYQGSDGNFYKSGYAPFFDSNGNPAAGVGVESGAGFLPLIRTLKEEMFLIASISILVTVTLSLIFSRSLTHPLKNLIGVMARASRSGALETVPVTRRDEIGYLGRRFNEMVETLTEKEQTLHKLYAMEKDRAEIIQRISAGLAHEIRNPLGAMSGYVELLERNWTPPGSPKEMDAKLRSLFEGMKDEVRILNRILTDFLSFAKEPGLKMEWVSPADLVQRAVAAALPTGSAVPGSVGRPLISVHYQMEDNLPEIQADPVALRKAFLNIVLNAVQAMPKGGHLTVGCASYRKSGDETDPVYGPGIETTTENGNNADAPEWLEIWISDTGPGIPEGDLEKVFHPFFTTKDEGTGLGLAISQKMIEEHGGIIRLLSQAGKGTTCRIFLPLRGER
jgi:signal transduction histidine kinase